MKILDLTIRGLRSFGLEAQTFDLGEPLAIIRAVNTQGKTSVAESLEFLLSGRLSKPLLAGGAPGEYENSLRNAHLPSSEEAVVAATIEFDDRSIHVLRRQLVTDYRGAQECESHLTLDGSTITSVRDIGFPLAESPLEAPVLLQHSLRYVVSAKPSERTDFFKALLEVSDLEGIRSMIDAVLRERESAPRTEALLEVAELGTSSGMKSLSLSIKKCASDSELQATLHSGAAGAAVAAGLISDSSDSEGLFETAQLLSREILERQSTIFPLSAFDARQVTSTITVIADEILEEVREYLEVRDSVDSRFRHLLGLYEKLLELPECDAATHKTPIDCPICATPRSLTPERLQWIRETLEAEAGLPVRARVVAESFKEINTQLNRMKKGVQGVVPAASTWNDDERRDRRKDAIRLGANEAQVDEIDLAILSMSTVVQPIVEKIDALRTLVATVVTSAGKHGEIDDKAPAKVFRAIAAITKAIGRLNDDASAFVDLAAVNLGAVRAAVSKQASTQGWQSLLDVIEFRESLWADILGERQRDFATGQLRSASQAIDLAIQQVIDNRFGRMSDEIARWWNLLRPSDHSVFSKIDRKGTGRQSYNIVASLNRGDGSPGAVRDAISVLSDSQLNALGLSAFLARCQLSKSPFIVLDDPVTGSDPEHALTFAGSVLEELLNSGVQVLLLTYDLDLERNACVYHNHLGISRYRVVLEDPLQGTLVIGIGDEFEERMAVANSLMRSPLEDHRRNAGNCLRIAAERLAKQIIVANKRSGGDVTASVGDYEKKNLRDLRDLVKPFALERNEPGLWDMFSRVLSDADHDVEPPLNAELIKCSGDLARLKRIHKEQISSLMDI